MNKQSLSEDDVRAKYIDPAIIHAGWSEKMIRRQYFFTDGRIYVKGNLTGRGKRKFADYVLYYKNNIPLALIEAKDNDHTIGDGMQQALDYANTLDIPFVFSSNGKGFLFHDKTVSDGVIEKELSMNEFPSPDFLWDRYKQYKNIGTPAVEKVVTQNYHISSKKPRYYQQIAINRTVEAIAKGENRILLVMATGTGKTYTAFQIAYRLWKSKLKQRILFLADRTALIDQTRRGDFRHFKDAMTVIKKKVVEIDGKEQLVSNKKRGIDSTDKAFSVFLGLYQGLSNSDPEVPDAFKDFSPDFFDLVIVDECHRGSAKEDSKWREILNYFHSATHIGMTATPKETEDVSNIDYFGEPIYTYSLKQGIADGFLAPYKVVKVTLDIDAEGWRPPKGFIDKSGNPVEDRIYNQVDFDKTIVVEERRQIVAQKITDFLCKNGRLDTKTIVFCTDIEHAEGMRQALCNANADLVAENSKYIMRITGDNQEGKDELDNFINPEETYPVIATTSKLMTTGVDAQTCKLIVLDSRIESMTEFKQIIGRGTRINEEFDKTFFTIMDFRNVTHHFADPDFDGEPVKVMTNSEHEDFHDAEDEDVDMVMEDDEEIVFQQDQIVDHDEDTHQEKIVVNGVEVSIIHERVQYLDNDGKIITESLTDYTRRNILNLFPNEEDFITVWRNAETKRSIVEELENNGIFIDALKEEIGLEYDPFDLICHIAFDAKPLTRKERAENVKKRNYFTKYGELAQKVISALLDKYASDGLLTIEDTKVLKLDPINKIALPVEIIEAFGGKESYKSALTELENALYKTA
ncbi:MAG: DEAD/DEAH box helicase family protein [Bacteroidales bacterium]|nr:DEAD/DEAH box helicase family protein [Candidatus Colimorpha pelethequi]